MGALPRTRLAALCVLCTGLALSSGSPGLHASTAYSSAVDAAVDRAFAVHASGDLAGAVPLYEAILEQHPTHAHTLHLLCAALATLGAEPERAVAACREAVRLRPEDANMWNTLGEALRMQGHYAQSLEAYESSIALDPTPQGPWANLGRALVGLGDLALAVEALAQSLHINPDQHDLQLYYADVLMMSGQHTQAEAVLEQLLHSDSIDVYGSLGVQLMHLLGTAYFHLGKLLLATDAYTLAMGNAHEDPRRVTDLLVNLGACYQMLGKFAVAEALYRQALDREPNDTRALSNLGSILTIEALDEEAMVVLTRAAHLSPTSNEVLSNLASLHQFLADPEDLDAASSYLQRVYELTGEPGALINRALALPIIMGSVQEYQRDRSRVEAALDDLLRMDVSSWRDKSLGDTGMLPFSLVYHGENDRRIMEKLGVLLLRANPDLLLVGAHLDPSAQLEGGFSASHPQSSTALTQGARKIRIGFVSKFFTANHAHGQLLRGIIAGLDRQYFSVSLFCIVNANMYLSPEVMAAADTVHHVPLAREEAKRALLSAALDILVFADQTSDLLTYQLGMGRYAAVQVVFWGNPTTPGHVDSIDYFMSGDVMEIDAGQTHYTEQLIRLEGQAIWYDKISLPPHKDLYKREQYGLQPDWVVFACPQSTFKMHPHFDSVLARILDAIPNARLMMVLGRRKQWTARLQARMRANMGPAYDRVIFYPRLPNSDTFMSFISVADVLLHPFPFDGSKTSADGLAMGMPVVTWPSTFLRGRMGASFYHAMGFLDLVANSADEYVDIAVRLGTDRLYRHKCATVIKHLSPVIWEREEVVAEWELFLLTSVGYSAPVRRAARHKLDAIHARDAQRLNALHSEVAALLSGSVEVPTPTPLPLPLPVLPPQGPWSGPFAPVYMDAMTAVRSLLTEGRLDEASILGADALTAAEVDDEGPGLHAVLHVLLAEVLLRQGKSALAGRHAERATLLAPGYPPGWLMRAAAAMGDAAPNGPRELTAHASLWFANATAQGACRDDWLSPALSALISRGLVLEASALLSRACGLKEGSEWALCLAATATVAREGVNATVALVNAALRANWINRGLFSDTVLSTPHDGEVLHRLTLGLHTHAPLSASMVMRALGVRLFECHTLLRKLEVVTRRGSEQPIAEPEAAPNARAAAQGVDPVTVVTWFSHTDACDRRCGGDSGNLTQPTPQAARRAGDAIAGLLSHPSIHRIVVATCSRDDSHALSASLEALGASTGDLSKLSVAVIGIRLTFATALALAQRVANDSDGIVAVLAPGTRFDSSLATFMRRLVTDPHLMGSNTVLALTPWSMSPGERVYWIPQPDRVVAWLTRLPLRMVDNHGASLHDQLAQERCSVENLLLDRVTQVTSMTYRSPIEWAPSGCYESVTELSIDLACDADGSQTTSDEGLALPGPNPCGGRIAHALCSVFRVEVVSPSLDLHILEEVPLPPAPSATQSQKATSGHPRFQAPEIGAVNLTTLMDVTGRHNYGRTFCPGVVSPELSGSSFISIGHGEVNGIMPGHSVSSAPLAFETVLTDADCGERGNSGLACAAGRARGLVPLSFL